MWCQCSRCSCLSLDCSTTVLQADVVGRLRLAAVSNHAEQMLEDPASKLTTVRVLGA